MTTNINRHRRIFRDNIHGLNKTFLKKFNLISAELPGFHRDFEAFIKQNYLGKILQKFNANDTFRVTPRQHLLANAPSDRILIELIQHVDIYHEVRRKRYTEFRKSFRNYLSYMLEKYISRVLKKTG